MVEQKRHDGFLLAAQLQFQIRAGQDHHQQAQDQNPCQGECDAHRCRHAGQVPELPQVDVDPSGARISRPTNQDQGMVEMDRGLVEVTDEVLGSIELAAAATAS